MDTALLVEQPLVDGLRWVVEPMAVTLLVRRDPAHVELSSRHVRQEPGRFEAGFGLVTPWDHGMFGQYAGVGMLHAVGPVATSRTSPLVDPWAREAQP